MKLILVTPPNYFVEEDKIITALFEEGLDMLHLRKPDTPPMYAERLLTLIPEQYHKRIVVHGHFYLKEEFRLKGIHLSERNPLKPERYKGHLSCTCHQLEDLKTLKQNHDYVFLGPVYPGIAPIETPAAFTAEALAKASRDGLIDKHVVAYNGISSRNIRAIKDYGFGWAALDSDIWNKFDRCITHDFSTLIAHFKQIQKLVD